MATLRSPLSLLFVPDWTAPELSACSDRGDVPSLESFLWPSSKLLNSYRNCNERLTNPASTLNTWNLCSLLFCLELFSPLAVSPVLPACFRQGGKGNQKSYTYFWRSALTIVQVYEAHCIFWTQQQMRLLRRENAGECLAWNCVWLFNCVR